MFKSENLAPIQTIYLEKNENTKMLGILHLFNLGVSSYFNFMKIGFKQACLSNRHDAWKKESTKSTYTAYKATIFAALTNFSLSLLLIPPWFTLIVRGKALDANVIFKLALEFMLPLKSHFYWFVEAFGNSETVHCCRCVHFRA